jgi:hypothetical protein
MDLSKANAIEGVKLIGNTLIVEKIKLPEPTTKSGLVMATEVSSYKETFYTKQLNFVRILATGAGYFDDDTGKDVPLMVRPGNIAVVDPANIRYFSRFGLATSVPPDTVGFTTETSVQMVFDSEEAFKAYFAAVAEASDGSNNRS